MTRTYSIAEANSRLSRLIHEAEEEGEVAVTRNGHPVALVISMERYRTLREATRQPSLIDEVRQLRAQYDMEEIGLDADESLAIDRDPSPGRDFSW